MTSKRYWSIYVPVLRYLINIFFIDRYMITEADKARIETKQNVKEGSIAIIAGEQATNNTIDTQQQSTTGPIFPKPNQTMVEYMETKLVNATE